jgi:hypothetical protein
MSNVSGKTSNGFTYEADHQPSSAGRVNWTATFRLDGNFAGMRHGRIHDTLGVSPTDVDTAVRVDIESTWTNAS